VATIGEFIEDLQLLSELLDGWRPTIQTVLFAPLLSSIIEQLTDRASSDSKVSLQLRMADDLLASRGDSAMLRRALFNLVDNALRFTGPEGTITITVRSTDSSTVLIEIRDTGRGMSATQIERLVRKRDGSLRSEQRGAGIGWRLASAIVEAHDGSVTPVSDGPDHGSTIRISLPLVTLNQNAFPTA
jgi:two-component system OmpR family sensor kinase